MTKTKSTKRALLLSALSLLLCVSMLVGSTFAWFTDSVVSGNNIIKSGNLDIELEYWTGAEWKDVKGASDILTNTLWEPGVTEVAYLRVANAGSLVLKYQLGINILNEIAGKNQAGEIFKLSDYIQFGVVEGVNGQTGAYSKDDAGRAAAIAAVTDSKKISAGYTKAATMDPDAELYLALVVYMPTNVGNVANHNGTDVPQIDLGINVYATQMTAENDSFNNQYDKDAWHPEMTILNVDDLNAAITNGVDAQLGADVTIDEDIVLTANLDLGGKTLSADYITATEDVEIVNGTLVMPEDTYLYAQNGVTITVEDVTIDSDKISAYAATSGTLILKDVVFKNTATSNPVQNYGGTLVMDNVTVAQSGDANTAWYSSAIQVINKIVKNDATGKYEITAQANTTINSGVYEGKTALFVSAPGGNVTINGGTFVGSEFAINAQFSPQNYTYGANYKSVITITGGDFTGALKFFPAVEVIITGGTFSVDPTAYLAAGYQAVDNGDGTWTVVKNVTNVADLADAIANGTTAVSLSNDIALNAQLDVNGELTVLGNGKTITAPANGTRVVNVMDNTADVTVTLVDVKLDAADKERGISFYNNSGDLDVTIIDCEITAKYYGVNVAGQNAKATLNIKDSTLTGYCAFQTFSPNTVATFDNCVLKGVNNWYNNTQYPTSNNFATVVVNSLANNSTLTFNNCTVIATEKDIATAPAGQWPATQAHIIDKATGTTINWNNCTFIKNGVEVSAPESIN